MNVERLISLHFPKAGGTSLQKQFATLLGQQAAIDYEHDPLTAAGSERAPFPAGKRVVHGHFRPERYASAEAFLCTFLRDPVQNLISIYFYWQTLPANDNPVHQKFLRERPDVITFAAYPAFSRLMSQTYFGGFDMRRFDFIGFHESRQEDIVTLGRLLGLPLRADIHENASPSDLRKAALLADASTLDRLRALLREDLAFYDRMRASASSCRVGMSVLPAVS